MINGFAAYFEMQAMLNKIHPPRPDWYEEFYALVLENGMKSYEAEVSEHVCSIFQRHYLLIES